MRGRYFGVPALVPAIAVASCLMLGTTRAVADGMMIPLRPAAKLFEPSQRAIIAWNGHEELLLLTTEVRSSEATRVLQVVPLPSEPKVSAGDTGPFERAVGFINGWLERYTWRARPPSGGDSKTSARPALGRITQRQQIGAHQLTVVQALDVEHFTTWVTDALKQQGATDIRLPDWVTEAIDTYLKDGIRWFVFDALEIGPELGRVQPIRYRFPSDRLYYPLRITRVEDQSHVDLTVFTRELFTRFAALPSSRVRRQHPPIAIPVAQVKWIDNEIAEIFAGPAPIHLRLWHIADVNHGFDQDLVAY